MKAFTHNFTHIIAVAILFLSASAANAQNQPDAIYRLLQRDYTVNQDGTMDIHYRKEITLLRNRAITAYADKGESFIVYNPEIESLTINESYTLRVDGSKVLTPNNAFVNQLPSGCADCGRYNGMRELAVIHTALEYNCTIVLDYTIHRNNIIVSDVFDLQTDCPVEKYVVTCNSNGRLRHHQAPKPSSVNTYGNTIKWVFNNIPQRSSESYMPHSDNYIMKLAFLTMPQYETRPSLAAAADIVADLHKEDSLAYITAIRDWVRDYIKTNDIPAEHQNFEPSAAIITFQSGCGTPLDKIALLCSMIREAGFTANIEDRSQDYFDINRVWVVVTIDNTPYSISPLNSRPPHIYMEGIAIEEFAVIKEDITIQGEVRNIGGGYYICELPKAPSCGVEARQLTSHRINDLRFRPVDYQCITQIKLNAPYKLIGKETHIRYEKTDIGRIEVRIKQIDDTTLLLTRKLFITANRIPPSRYNAFRKLIIDWESLNEVYLIKK